MENAKTKNLFAEGSSIADEYIFSFTYPWEALSGIGEEIRLLGFKLDPDRFWQIGEDIWVAKSASIAESASLHGPLLIDEDAQVRPGAFLRGSAIVGKGAVVGNSTELKNVILFDRVQVPHYNYVGDSLLGCGAHMGAGSITSNLKSDESSVVVKDTFGSGEERATGLRKVGAMLADHVQIGCNCVLNPGTVVGKNSIVYPLCSVRGVVPPDRIYKDRDHITKRK